MIAFSRLEQKGNLGNQFFQIASTIGLAKANSQDFTFPEWKYNQYFKNQLPSYDRNTLRNYNQIEECQHHYKHLELTDSNYDLNGWFQSEKYFNKELTKYYFEFETSYLNQIKLKHNDVFSRKTIYISIRRGDYVSHKDFYQLSFTYYFNALIYNFPDWKDYNIVVCSDDTEYLDFYFGALENVFIIKKTSAIDQLCIASLCDHFIISNSTFSWWAAYLGEKPHSKIICPQYFFSDKKRETESDKDFYPERWMKFKYEDYPVVLHIKELKISNNAIKQFYETNFRINIALNDCTLPKIAINNHWISPLFLLYLYNQNTNLKINNAQFVPVFKNEIKTIQIDQDFGRLSIIFTLSKFFKTQNILSIKWNDLDMEQIKFKNLKVGKISIFPFYSFKKMYIRKKIKLKTTIKKLIFGSKKNK